MDDVNDGFNFGLIDHQTEFVYEYDKMHKTVVEMMRNILDLFIVDTEDVCVDAEQSTREYTIINIKGSGVGV